jgi:hypothetical protein
VDSALRSDRNTLQIEIALRIDEEYLSVDVQCYKSAAEGPSRVESEAASQPVRS